MPSPPRVPGLQKGEEVVAELTELEASEVCYFLDEQRELAEVKERQRQFFVDVLRARQGTDRKTREWAMRVADAVFPFGVREGEEWKQEIVHEGLTQVCSEGPVTQGRVVAINTLYKPVGRKMKPVDDAPPDGSKPEGDPNWKQKRLEAAKLKARWGHRWDSIILPRFSDIPLYSRLTPERLEALLKTVPLLRIEERKMLTYIFECREEALAWDFPEMGRIHPDVIPPQYIHTVPYKAWQSRSIPIPKPMIAKVIELLRTRLDRGTLEFGHGPYRNKWFLVTKKDGGLRLINDAQLANRVTKRDAYTPPTAEEISEDFGGCQIISVLDLFSGYDQLELHEACRNLTSFATPLGLVRSTRVPMGGTNSVAQFQRAMTTLLSDLIPQVCRVYIDDICIRGARHDYDNEEFEPGIRRFVAEHLLNVNNVLLNCELAGATMSAAKSQWCQKTAVFLGYVCGPEGRGVDEAKIKKVKEWVVCRDVKDVRSFMGLVGFYRTWINRFAHIARPLYDLLKKNSTWNWSDREQNAMDTLKEKLITAPILAPLVFDDDRYGGVFIMVDASLMGWGAVLEQIGPDKRRHPCRFQSGIWSEAEQRYDATKRELRGLLCAMRSWRHYLYGVHFTVETDALVLVHQLNGSMTDVPGALLMRWIAWIRIFDFTVRHVAGLKNSAADALSRKPPGDTDLREKDEETDIDDFVDAQIFMQQLAPAEANIVSCFHQRLVATGMDTATANVYVQELHESGLILKGSWSPESHDIAEYLTTLSIPASITGARKQQAFKNRALKYFIQLGSLWLRPRKQKETPRLVVDPPASRYELFKKCHDANGHRGREETIRRVRERWYWKGMYTDIDKWVQGCHKCQMWATKRFEESAQFTTPSPIPFARWTLDIQFLPGTGEKAGQDRTLLLEARDDLTGWLEATIVKSTKASETAQFIKWLILRWGVPLKVTIDGGSEFQKEALEVLRVYYIIVIKISA